jgi:hypothetical protein
MPIYNFDHLDTLDTLTEDRTFELEDLERLARVLRFLPGASAAWRTFNQHAGYTRDRSGLLAYVALLAACGAGAEVQILQLVAAAMPGRV